MSVGPGWPPSTRIGASRASAEARQRVLPTQRHRTTHTCSRLSVSLDGNRKGRDPPRVFLQCLRARRGRRECGRAGTPKQTPKPHLPPLPVRRHSEAGAAGRGSSCRSAHSHFDQLSALWGSQSPRHGGGHTAPGRGGQPEDWPWPQLGSPRTRQITRCKDRESVTSTHPHTACCPPCCS